MNVHDELRRSLISKLTEVNERKLHKPLFLKVFMPRSFPQKELCVLVFFFPPLLIPDFQESPTPYPTIF